MIQEKCVKTTVGGNIRRKDIEGRSIYTREFIPRTRLDRIWLSENFPLKTSVLHVSSFGYGFLPTSGNNHWNTSALMNEKFECSFFC